MSEEVTMDWTPINTQADLDAAIAKGSGWLDLKAAFRFTLTAGKWHIRAELRENASAELRGNASAVLWENASAVLWGNASAELRGNASAELWGNASAVLWENAFARVFSAKKIRAVASAVIMLHGTVSDIEGGQQIKAFKPSSPSEWCEFYGVAVADGVAIIYKSVDGDYSTRNARKVGISYKPGSVPAAPDWDGGKAECGGGLHASPHPKMAKYGFNRAGTHAIACPVKLDDIVVHPNGDYPDKVKFRACCAPVYEVDWNGIRLPDEASK